MVEEKEVIESKEQLIGWSKKRGRKGIEEVEVHLGQGVEVILEEIIMLLMVDHLREALTDPTKGLVTRDMKMKKLRISVKGVILVHRPTKHKL
jgi:hypothetical protein